MIKLDCGDKEIIKDYPRDPNFNHKYSDKREAARDYKEITKKRGEDSTTTEAEFGVMQPQDKEFKLSPNPMIQALLFD